MKTLVVFFTLLSVLSCTERIDVKESIVDFSSLHVNTPVVLSHFSSDSFLLVSVGSTQQAFREGDEVDIPIIENATIENLETGIAEKLYPNSTNPAQYFAKIRLSEGVAFRINLEFPDFTETHVWATDTVPFVSKIKSVMVTPEAKNIENNLLTLVRLEIAPSFITKLSFYEISVNTTITDTSDYMGLPVNPEDFASGQYLYSDDPIITREDYYPSPLQFDAFPPKNLYFKKQHFSETFLVEFYYDPPGVSIGDLSTGKTNYHIYSHTATVLLKTVSNNYYQYHVSRLKQFYSREGDPLYGVGEPVNVFTNIKNGVGIFASYTCDSINYHYQNE